MAARFCYIWEYLVRPDSLDQFVEAYCSDGTWVGLFRQADGYIRTELLRDPEVSNRFLTIDYWECRADHQAFRARFDEGFRALDAACEALTEREILIGHFDL